MAGFFLTNEREIEVMLSEVCQTIEQKDVH